MGENLIWSVMVVDDEEEERCLLKGVIEGQCLTDKGDKAKVTPVSDFDGALPILESGRYDLAILDVREGDSDEVAGEKLQRDIKSARFVPIIFHTGWPEQVKHLENPPFIQVVTKGDPTEKLLEAIRRVLSSQLPAVNRALARHVDKIQREYMWEFVANNWDRITGQGDSVSIAYLLARRLATSLSDQPIAQLAGELTGQFDVSNQNDRVHPMQYYVMPPMSKPARLAGDIYKGTLADQDGYWVMLTPSCDLVHDKADRVLLAMCLPLSEQPEFARWSGELSGRSHKRLTSLLRNNRQGQADRFFYLPGVLNLPGLVVDLQNVISVTLHNFDSSGVDRLATLDSPFAEALASRFIRLFGRLGTPDLDVDWITTQLKQARDSTADTQRGAAHKEV